MPWSTQTYRGGLVRLRPPIDSDLDDFLAKAGQPETILAYGGDPSTLTAPTPESYRQGLGTFPDSIKWVIDHDGHAIGRIRLDNIDETEGHARLALGIWHPDDWGHGFGTEASMLALGHAFNAMRLHRVDLIVLEENRRAIRSYEKCGFRVEGVLRERALVRGQRQNDLVMAVLRREFAGLGAGKGADADLGSGC